MKRLFNPKKQRPKPLNEQLLFTVVQNGMSEVETILEVILLIYDLFFHTIGLLRHQGCQKNEKRPTKVAKANQRPHSHQ